MHRPFKIVTDALSHPVAMLTTVILTVYWIYTDPSHWYDALLAGGAMLLAQGIYKTGAPREKAVHTKLDEIIHAIDKANDDIAGIEERVDKTDN